MRHSYFRRELALRYSTTLLGSLSSQRSVGIIPKVQSFCLPVWKSTPGNQGRGYAYVGQHETCAGLCSAEGAALGTCVCTGEPS